MRNLLRTASSTLAALVLAAPVLLGSAPASASSPRPFTYDALGDSYAAGFGVQSSGECGRSPLAYPEQLDGRMRIDLDGFVACAGATTLSLVSGGQLGALDSNTDLVTLTIGGNDIGWSTAIGACIGGSDAQCGGALGLSERTITSVLPGLLDTVYADVAAAAPGAHVTVTGYPRLFSPQYGPFLEASVAEQQALNNGADLLNSTIAAEAAKYGFQFVDVTRRFADHGVNAPEPWILGPAAGRTAFHPTPAGYRAYTAALTAAIIPARLP